MSSFPIAPLLTRFLSARLAPSLTLTESGFLFSAQSGETYSLNFSGACLLAALKRGVAPSDLWQELVQRFAISEPQAQRDVQLFLARLYTLGLLQMAEPAGADVAREAQP